MKLVMIAAVGKNRELGLCGDMPWKRGLKEDLAFFRKTTAGHPILMGRRTLESLPGLLPGRLHLVISSHPENLPEKVICYSSPETFFKAWKDLDETVFVIGGGSIYKAMLPYCDAMLLTEVEAAFDADTWFPVFDRHEFERSVLSEQQDGKWITKHVFYQRKGESLNPD